MHPKYESFEEVGLARAVGPGDDGQALGQRDIRLLIAAEVAQGEARNAHYTLSLIGMIRYWKRLSSAASMQARAAGG